MNVGPAPVAWDEVNIARPPPYGLDEHALNEVNEDALVYLRFKLLLVYPLLFTGADLPELVLG